MVLQCQDIALRTLPLQSFVDDRRLFAKFLNLFDCFYDFIIEQKTTAVIIICPALDDNNSNNYNYNNN